MNTALTLILAGLLWPGTTLDSGDDPPNATAKEAGFLVESAAGSPSLVLPRAERLVYRARIELGPISASVGAVTQTCSVVPYRQTILLAQPPADAGDLESATITIRAKGDYQWYSMDSTIESRILPQAWPRVTYRQISEGTEKRRREIKLGLREGAHSSSYRKDTRDGAEKGTRIWREPKFREVPEGTVDLLTAVFYARTMIREELDELSFPMIDKRHVWQLTLRRGKEKRIKTKAGTFDVVEAVLDPGVYPGEEIDEDKIERFEGLFGIHGSIHLWVEKHTGVPVHIEGDLPVGLVTLGIDVVLESYEGTPAGFEPVTPEE
jgi:hypothetical protein